MPLPPPRPALALGIELTLVRTEDGGRVSPVVPAGDGTYRPNWGLPSMAPPGQTGAPVWRFSRTPVEPGDTVHAVILVVYPRTEAQWRAEVLPGAVLPMYDGPRVHGHGRVLWTGATRTPVPEQDAARFARWLAHPGDVVDGGGVPVVGPPPR